MAMLNFKYGLHSNLPQNIVDGTVYVTSDEKAMYVDLGGNRIRLGQIVSIPTITEWEKMQPPFSTEAFYYVVEANALIKYNGEVEGEHSWTQINSTAALEEKINAQLNTIKEDIKDLQDDVKDLQDADTVIEAEIDVLEELLNFVGKVDTLPLTGTVGDVCLLDETYYHCTAVADNGAATFEAYAGVGADLEALRARIKTLENTTATDAAITNLNKKVDDINDILLGEKDENDERAGGLVKEVEAHGEILEAIPETYATKTELATEKSNILGKDENGQDFGHTVKEAYELAQAAQGSANNANTKADANEKILKGEDGQSGLVKEVADIKAGLTDYATKAELQKAQEDLLGTADDASTANTIHGAKKAAAEALVAANGAQNTANTADQKAQQALDAINNETTGLEAAHEAAKAADEKAQGVKNAVEHVETGLAAAHTKAEAAQGAAEGAQATANSALEKAKDNEDILLGEEVNGVRDGGLVKDVADNAQEIKTIKETYATKNDLSTGLADYVKTETFTAYQNTVKGQFDGILNGEEIESFAGVEAALEKIEADYVDKIQTADALKFVGVVDSVDDLPTSGVAVGATYKSKGEFIIGEGTENATFVYVGDLLIATGTENKETGLLDAITWEHVPSGYVADYNPEMSLATGDNSAVIQLASGVAKDDEFASNDGDLGAITVKGAEDSAVTVAAADNTITIGMTWGTF